MNHSLQALRYYAASCVVLAHIAHYIRQYNISDHPFFHWIENWGVCGVDIFFVISGYLMVFVQKAKHRSGTRFWLDRLLRIVPLYWILTLLLALVLYNFPEKFKIAAFSWTHLFLSLMFASNFIVEKAPLLTVGWSLEYEVFFYFIFSLAIAIFQKIEWVAIATVLMIGLCFLVNQGAWYLGLEFSAGLLLGFVRVPKWRCPSYFIGLLVFVLSAIGQCLELPRAIGFGIPAVLMVFFALSNHSSENLMSKLGGYTYEIYLIQVFVLPLFFRMVVNSEISINISILFVIAFTSTTLSEIALSCIYRKSLGPQL